MSIPYEERFRICEKQSKPAGCAAGKKTCRPSLKPGRWRVSRRASAPPRGVHTTQRTCANEGQSHKPKCSILGPRSGLNVKFESENDAMTTSKTIAALLGPTLVASAISLLANLGTSRTIIEGLSQSPALIMIAGYAAFVPGLAIVYFHNRWTGGWPMLVTVMGWLSLVVGLLRMVFPTPIAALTMKIAPSAAGVFPVVAVVFLLIGGFLSFKAYGREGLGRRVSLRPARGGRHTQ